MRVSLLRVGLIGLITSVAVAYFGVTVQAGGLVSPWAGKEAHLLASAEVPYAPIYDNARSCDGGTLGSIRLKQDESTDYPACVFGELGEVRIARFYHPQWFTTYVISFKSDTEFYRIEGICGGMAGCSYAPKTDTFLMQTFVGSWQKIAGLHRNFTDKLQRQVDVTTGAISYSFQQEHEPLYFEIGTMPAAIESAAFSHNGEWLALEYKSLGIIRAHVETLDIRRISAPGNNYGYGSDPLVELAISNDGSSISVMGRRMGLMVVGIDAACGDKMTTQDGRYFASGVLPCQSASIDYYSMFRAFYYAGYPSFSQDGKKLSLIAVSLYGDYTKAVLSPEATSLKGMYGYIGLGDSFSSGEGETSNAEYLPQTDTPPHRCHVSKRSYPFLVSSVWSVNGLSVACSGATTADIYGDGVYKGQGNRLLGLGDEQQKTLQHDAINSIRQGIIRQSEFVEKYQPDVVTLGIGGNDAGFIDKLKSCLGVGTCAWAKDSVQRVAAGREIQSVFGKIQASVKKIKEISPESKIILVGYPEIINATAECGGVVGLMLDAQERTFMSEAIQLLNNVVSEVAAAEGEYFANVQDVYGNNSLCNQDPTAMNGVRIGNDIAPISTFPKMKVIGSESFHPTPYGHALVAQRIVDQFPDAPYMQPCNCSSGTVRSDLTSYWIDDNVVDSEVRKLIRQDSIAGVYRAGDTVNIQVPAGTFEPNSPVRIEIHSEPILLKEIAVDAKGGIATNVELPAGLVDGYHTMHILGTNRSLESVDVYQLITVSDEPVVTPGAGSATQPLNPIVSPVETALIKPDTNNSFKTSTATQIPANQSTASNQDFQGFALVNPGLNSEVEKTADTPLTLGALSTKKSQENIASILLAVGVVALVVLVGWVLWVKFARSKR